MFVPKLCWILAVITAVTSDHNVTSGPYMNVRATASDEIELTWQRPDCNENISHYRLDYLNKQNNKTTDIRVDHQLTKYKVTDLDTSTVYYLRLSWKCNNGKQGTTKLKQVKTLNTDGTSDDRTQEWYDSAMFYFGLGAGGTLILVIAITSLGCIISNKLKKRKFKPHVADAEMSLKQKSLERTGSDTKQLEYTTQTMNKSPADSRVQTKRYRQLAGDTMKDAQYDTTENKRPASDMYLHPKTLGLDTSSAYTDDMYTDFDSVSIAAADGNDKQLCPYNMPIITSVAGSNPSLDKRARRQGTSINETTVQISLSFKTGSRDNMAVSVCEDQ